MAYSIVVCVKQVPDTKKITGNAMREDGTVNRAALPAIFNPEDRNALEAALRVREEHGGTVTVLTMGLPAACEVWLRARDADKLQGQQREKAMQAEILMRGLAHIGIVALVDEATGYQEVRDKMALQAILDKFLAKELAAWAKRFPDEFYQQMFRLKGWPFDPGSVARPGIVGKYTVDVVYERLAPGLVDELERINPKSETGSRKSKHHQWLSTDIGHVALAQHLHAVLGFMRACKSWDQFIGMLDIAFPKKGRTIPLQLE